MIKCGNEPIPFDRQLGLEKVSAGIWQHPSGGGNEMYRRKGNACSVASGIKGGTKVRRDRH